MRKLEAGIKKVLKISCGIQGFNAFMDYLVWFIYGYLVPSWTIATVMLFNAVIIYSLVRSEE